MMRVIFADCYLLYQQVTHKLKALFDSHESAIPIHPSTISQIHLDLCDQLIKD